MIKNKDKNSKRTQVVVSIDGENNEYAGDEDCPMHEHVIDDVTVCLRKNWKADGALSSRKFWLAGELGEGSTLYIVVENYKISKSPEVIGSIQEARALFETKELADAYVDEEDNQTNSMFDEHVQFDIFCAELK